MKSFAIGALVGFILAVVGGGLLVIRNVHAKQQPVRDAKKPRQVLVATRELARGTVVTNGDFREVSAETEFVDGWAVGAEDRDRLVKRPLSLALGQGDVVHWSSFASIIDLGAVDSCAAAVSPVADQAGQTAGSAALAKFKATAPSLLTGDAPPPLAADAEGMIEVVIAARDLQAGQVLTQADLRLRRIPAQLVTDSVVRSDEAPGAVGERLNEPLQAGDPLLYVFLEDDEAPKLPWACVDEVTAAQTRASAEAARAAADAFVRDHLEAR